MKTRKITAISLAALMGLSTAACASSSSETKVDSTTKAPETTANAAESKTDAPENDKSAITGSITYSTWGGAEEKKTEEAIIEAFKKDYPNVNVEMIFVDGNYEEKLQALVAGNEIPDVISIGSAHIASFSGAFRPLSEDLGKDANYISPMLKECLVYDGNQYALPKRANTKVYAYNKTLLTNAKVEFPKGSYDIDQFTKDATAVSELSEDTYGSDALWFGQWIYQFGGEMIDKDGKIAFNNETGKKAAQYCVDAVKKYGFAPSATATQGQDVMQWFISGQVGFKGDFGPYFLPLMSQISSFDWDVCAAPGNGGEMEVVGVAVGKDTKYPEAAELLAEYISTNKNAQEIIGGTSALPVTEDGKQVFLAQYPDKNLQAFFDAMQVQSVPRNIKGANQIGGILFGELFDRTALGAVGDEDIATVLDDAAKEAQEALDDAQ